MLVPVFYSFEFFKELPPQMLTSRQPHWQVLPWFAYLHKAMQNDSPADSPSVTGWGRPFCRCDRCATSDYTRSGAYLLLGHIRRIFGDDHTVHPHSQG